MGIAWGCEEAHQDRSNHTSESSPKAISTFESSISGIIHGRVTWAGDPPIVSPFQVYANPGGCDLLKRRQLQPNPNSPRIDSQTGGVGNAVVFIRGVDATKSRPWDLSPVRVEQGGLHFHVHQGETDSIYGFVRRGDSIEMVSRDQFLHALHAGGASFFTLMFPHPDQPLVRPLKEKGVVELTSAAGCYWMRAYLFVDDHPYFARTDAQGGFTLTHVPPGRYELVCWMPNWKEARHERDPETGLITRLFFARPLKLVEQVNVKPKESQEVQFSVSAKDFKP
jgi:hypothetical protein